MRRYLVLRPIEVTPCRALSGQSRSAAIFDRGFLVLLLVIACWVQAPVAIGQELQAQPAKGEAAQAAAAEAPDRPYFEDLAMAGSAAVAQGKRLLVFDAPSDLMPDDKTALPPFFEWITDREVAAHIQDHYVPVVRFVGPPKAILFVDKKGNPVDSPGQEIVLTYFCMPDGTVLHLIIGHVSKAAFLRNSNWVRSMCHPVPDDQKEKQLAIRTKHRERLLSEHVAHIEQEQIALWKNDEPPDELLAHHIEDTVKEAAAFRKQQIRRRFGSAWTATQHQLIVPAMAAHGELEPEYIHVLLSELAGVHIDRLRQPAYEQLAHQKFWTASQTSQAAITAYRSAVQQNQPTLFVIEVPPRQKQAAILKSPNMARVMNQFVVARRVTLADLAIVLDACELEKITLPRSEQLQFVAYRPDGKLAATLTDKHSVTTTTRLLQRVVESLDQEPNKK